MNRLALGLGCALVALGCRVTESVDPAPTTGAAVTSSGAGGSEDGPVIRTVDVRSPWGGPPENLLTDGDFELSISAHGSADSWFVFAAGNGAQRDLRGETGGLCHTGLRCAILDASTVMFGRGTAAPPGSGLKASIWARVPTGRGCDAVKAAAVDCDTGGFPVSLKAKAPDPDAGGWCSYEVSLAKTPTKRCMYVESKLESGEFALVDSAAFEVVPPPAALQTPTSIDVGMQDRARAVARRVRDLTPFGKRTSFEPASAP